MSAGTPSLWTLDPPWTPRLLRLIYLLVLALIAIQWLWDLWVFLRANMIGDREGRTAQFVLNDGLWFAFATFKAVVAALVARLLGEVVHAVFQILAHQRPASDAGASDAPTRPLRRKEPKT